MITKEKKISEWKDNVLGYVMLNYGSKAASGVCLCMCICMCMCVCYMITCFLGVLTVFSLVCMGVFFVFVSSEVLNTQPMALCIISKQSTTELLPQPCLLS